MLRTRSLLDAGAVFAVIAALVHAWVSPAHFEEWWGYGLFFLVVATVQALLAMALLGEPENSLLMAGIVANAGILLLYLVTRTAGVPIFGPAAGEVEDVSLLDLSSTIAAVALAAVLTTVLVRRWRVSAPRVDETAR